MKATKNAFSGKKTLVILNSRAELSEVLQVAKALKLQRDHSIVFRFSGAWLEKRTIDDITLELKNAQVILKDGSLVDIKSESLFQENINVHLPNFKFKNHFLRWRKQAKYFLSPSFYNKKALGYRHFVGSYYPVYTLRGVKRLYKILCYLLVRCLLRSFFSALKLYYSILNSVVFLSIINFIVFRRGVKRARSMLSVVSPDLVVVAEGTLPYEIMYFMVNLRNCKIPVVVFPYTIANWKEYFLAYKDAPMYQSNFWFARVMKYFDPQLFKKYQGVEISRIPYYSYLAYKFHKVLPAPAWTMNSLPVDKIFTDSPFLKEYFLEGGIEDKKLEVVGSSSLDNLFVEESEKKYRIKLIASEYGKADDRKIILCCPPPDQGNRKLYGFNNYNHFLQEFVSLVKEKFSNEILVFKFHPRTPDKIIKDLETQHKVISSKHETSWLISICDLYITSVSATIRWALAASVPVINFDVYNYDYTEYKNSNSVITIFKFPEFVEQMNLLTEDNQAYTKLKKIAEQESTCWGFNDGQSMSRILSSLDRLI